MQQINEAYALLEYETVESEMAPQRLRAKNDALYAIACRLISDDNILSLKKAIPILECDLIGWKDSASLFEESRKRLAQLVGKQSEEFSS